MNERNAIILVAILAIGALLGSIVPTIHAFNVGEEKSGSCNLTEAQKEEIKQAIGDMKEAGASKEEIKTEIIAKLERWGLEVPECLPLPQRNRRLGQQSLGELTEDQREEIKQIINDMREDDASREEIKEAIDSKLGEFGIEVPEKKMPQRQPWMQDLTDGQREEIRQTVEELREVGTSREEIKETINSKLTEWGIEVSEHRGLCGPWSK